MISHLIGTLTKKTEARRLPHPAPTAVGAPLSRARGRGNSVRGLISAASASTTQPIQASNQRVRET